MKASTSPDAALAFSYFENIAARTIQSGVATWPALVNRLENVKAVASKEQCGLIKLAEFGEHRSRRDSLRNNENVVSVSGLEGDYDAEEVSPEEAVHRLEKHRIRAVVYTSPSHTDEKPRWRVLAPLSRPHLPTDRPLLMARLNGALGGILAPESFTLSQSYYIGRIEGRTYKTLPCFDDPDDGMPIDQLDALDAIAAYPINSSSYASDDADGAGIGAGSRNRTLTSIAGTHRRAGLSAVELEATLLSVNRERCNPPLSDAEVRSIARSVGRYNIGQTAEHAPSAQDEAGRHPLDEVETFLRRFVAYPSEHACVAHVLWIAHTHLMESWDSTPRIAFLSPEVGSGKSRSLEVSELLVPNPVESINVSPAYIFRKIGSDDGRPTLLYDEIDTVFGPKAKDNEETRGLLNAGHRRHGYAGRCVVRGKEIFTEEIPAYCAVALAGLGDLPETILSRCVIVRMRRRAPNEQVEPFRRRIEEPRGSAIRARLATWANGVSKSVSNPWPEMPPGVSDRHADVWEALLAVADAAGGSWPQRACVAAVELVEESKRSTPSLGIRLLSDLKGVFGDRDAMSTKDILAALCALEESPWADIKGKPINDRSLAFRLKQYQISSKKIRFTAGSLQGYDRADFHDSWLRYLSEPPIASGTSGTGGTKSADVPNVPDVPAPMGDQDKAPW